MRRASARSSRPARRAFFASHPPAFRAASHPDPQEPVGNPLKDATAREALIEHLSRAAASSERVYHTIMWYNLRLQCVFSAAQLCKAAGDPGRPMLPFEFVCAVVQRRRSADLAAAEALQS